MTRQVLSNGFQRFVLSVKLRPSMQACEATISPGLAQFWLHKFSNSTPFYWAIAS